MKDATKEYRGDMDLIGRWIDERCTEDDKLAEVTTKLLHIDYSAWARHEIGFPMSAIAFGRALAARGFKPKKKDWEREGFHRG